MAGTAVHSYDGGYPNGVAWTIQIPEDSIQVELGSGTASLHFTDEAVKEWISVPNSLSMGTLIKGTPLPASMSLDIEWAGVEKRLGRFSDEALGFTDDLVEVSSVTVAASTVQAQAAPGATVQSFTFTSEPTSFSSSFSVVGRERNGSFARSRGRKGPAL